MGNITTGAVLQNSITYDSASATYSVSLSGNQISGYTQTYPIYNPSGFFSRPMPGQQGLFTLSPYGGTGYVMGFSNASPNPDNSTNNISDLIDGEVAISETSDFNFNIKAKLTGLLSTFTNSNDEIIDSNLTIGQNVVTCFTDIVAEIVALEEYINTQIVPALNSPPPVYVPTVNFIRDKTFLDQSPSEMYINLDGELIT